VKAYEAAAVAAGAAYLVVLGWAMQSLSYDIWGALVVTPVLALISIPLINRAFTDDLATLRPWVWTGLAVKFAGAVAGYNVRFDAYGGSADAGRYHNAGKLIAGQFHDGAIGIFGLIPSGGTGTQFLEKLTGLVYVVSGTSRLGGFMVFTWMSFWGLAFCVKAAHHAIGGFATRRYALTVFFFPSLVYWGSSIGKEAFVGLCLGISAYGASLVLTRRGGAVRGFVLLAVGLVGAAYVRPHFAAIWAGAVLIALVARVMLDAFRRSDRGSDERRRSQVGTILLLAVAGIGFVIVAQITLSYLDPADDNSDEIAGEEVVTDRLSNIFDETERRTTTGGSSFEPISIDGPQDWPLAAFRTLTRPLLYEARGLAAALPAIEMTALLLVGVVSWRRLAHTPKLMLTTPYLVFAALCVITFGVAFASIGNLGILTRQRSLVLPLLLVFWCLPPIVFASERAKAELDARTGARDRAADQAAGRRPTPLPSRGR
jgi:hypothetical protein